MPEVPRARRALRAARRRARGLVGRAEPATPAPTAPAPPVPRPLLRALEAALGERTHARVAVLVGEQRPTLLDRLADRHPGWLLTVVDASLDDDELHLTLAVAGPYDAVVDATGVTAEAPRQWERAFFHTVRGGVYLVRVPADPAPDAEVLTWVERLRAGADAPTPQRRPRPGPPRPRTDDVAGLAVAAVAGLRERDGVLTLVNAVEAFAKLDDVQLDTLVERRPPADRVTTVETVAGQAFTSRCDLRESGDSRSRRTPTAFDAPRVALRRYRDVLCVPGQIAVQGNVLLPDTFRHNRAAWLFNRYTRDLGRRFAALEDDVRDAPVLEGDYFYLDDEYRGHFGHALTEQIARLWAVDRARREAPGLKALMTVKNRELHSFEVELYGTCGFAAEDLVLVHEPVRVERLWGASPMFSNPDFVHPRVAETWDRIGRALSASAPVRDYPARMFVSRRIRKRACLNTDEVEAAFAERGFAVVYPEDHGLAEQVEMFRRAEVVAGFAGSGLFHLCFAEEPKKVLMLSHQRYIARNEYLMASVRCHELHAVVSEALPLPKRKRVPGQTTGFHSPFRVDWEREGRYLLDVLDQLDGPDRAP